MDCVSPILDILAQLWDCTATNSSYIRHLKKNLKSLSEARRELEDLSEDVNRRVEEEEQQQRKRKKVVQGWLDAVESQIKEVDVISRKGEQEVQKKCLGSCCIYNCYSGYKIGKKVINKIRDVKELIKKGEIFENLQVTYKLPRPTVDGMVMEETVGFDSMVDEVWGHIEDYRYRIIGLYGIGGVGKTTLLKKLCSKFIDINHHFDLVIWVAVSKEANLEKIQEAIRKKLNISDQMWKNKGEEDKATEILISLRSKRFVLLLDDVWERLDLSKIGVSLYDNQKGSKIVFTTRSQEVCGQMGAHRRFKVECLSPEASMDLFRLTVGEDVFNSHPEIPRLAQIVVEECQGLPLALITVARAMSSRRGPREWQHAIDELQSNPFRFAGMGNLVLPILRFSYDSLSDDVLKTCFLYCSLFPKEHNIRKDELIELWVAEGFLNRADPRNEGEYIIGSLELACLLEKGEYSEDFVVMHDVIREMAFWLASKECKIVVREKPNQQNKSDDLKEALRMSVWGSGVDFLHEATSCPRLRTLLIRFSVLEKFPSRFARSMHALAVLDLSYNFDLVELPELIGKLINLCHLNLSNTKIRELPAGIKYLKNLKILRLDGMLYLQTIPQAVISSLSSLQVFSWFSTELVALHHNFCCATTVLAGLESLENIHDISITLCFVDTHAFCRFQSSPKLQSCVKRLTVASPLFSSLDFRMDHLETLEIVDCSLESINIYFGDQGRTYCFRNLRHLSVKDCHFMTDLKWIRCAPNLQFLYVSDCHVLSEIIGTYESPGTSEIEESHHFLSNLMVIDLQHLPSLTSICGRAVPLPSLKTISVYDCPGLRKLPLNSGSAKNRLNAIRGSREWWDQLEWEDEDTKNVFASKFLVL